MQIGPEHQQYNVHAFLADKAHLLNSVHQQFTKEKHELVAVNYYCYACANGCLVGILQLGVNGAYRCTDMARTARSNIQAPF